MERLTLQITKENFDLILKGEQKVEHRYIYPSNAKKYVRETEDGEVECVHYDALYLINGRRKDAPRLLVEVVSAEFVIFQDEGGNDMTFKEDGQEYLCCQVWYHLGKILQTENIQ